MSLFNRLKNFNKLPMINLDVELKSETFDMFEIWSKLKENEPRSQLHTRLIRGRADQFPAIGVGALP